MSTLPLAMSSKKDTIRFMKRQIESGMILSESGRYFLPDFALESIFTIQNIERAVNELHCDAHERIGLARKIFEEAVRTFAILVRCGEEYSIISFREHGVTDSSLPLSEECAVRITGEFGAIFASEYQWQFLPFVFRKEMSEFHTQINKRRILPYLDASQYISGGASGDVSRVQLFPLLQQFMPIASKHVWVIRKKIRVQEGQSKESYEKAFRNEQRCLVLLNRLEHPNIVRLLASYSYGGEHYFLFSALDMNLEEFLEMETPVARFEHSITFYAALEGLASALRHTHNLHLEGNRHGIDFDGVGYHHDLRPANILVSSETFILADFGLGKFKTADLPSQTRWKAGTDDYLAPECMDENLVHQNVGRAIDVWAFGCLIVEVITYMKEGARSLKDFRQSRLSPGRDPQWSDHSFFGKEGIIKPKVQIWLTRLMAGALTSSPLAMLARLAGRALKGDPYDRPKMADLCVEITFISLKAHFGAVRSLFQAHVERCARPIDRPSMGMTLWFEQERFLTFGQILGLHDDDPTLSLIQDLAHLHNDIRKIMTRLYFEFKDHDHQTQRDQNQSPDHDLEYSSHVEALETRIKESVKLLWDCLPTEARRKGEAFWIRAILRCEEPGYFNEIQHSFRLEDDPAYEEGAAMAMMKQIRLEIDSNPTEVPEDSILSHKDVQIGKSARGHTLGLFKTTTPVLVEWMYYSPAWKAIPPHERAIVMGLKAQGFRVKPKPSSLRILDCVGAFESTGKKKGYAFIYKIPGLEDGAESVSSFATLLQLLESPETYISEVQYPPTLGERYRLAAMLASFLEQFHCIGWLHKDFNSNNVLFVRRATQIDQDNGLSPIIVQPYVVGLNKSRPGGDAWHTQGPASGENFQEYRHPGYARTGRYHMDYDYYSFGLILLEIGFWRPLRHWSLKHPTVDLSGLRQALLENYVPRLGAQMGAVYQEVTRFCLSIDSRLNNIDDVPSEEAGQQEGPDELARIIQKIIEPLEMLGRMTV
ncbi:uncharacterized protein KY384_007902 [Bacidia gigantensis]|uniref:uncharacterized protein n=1 Tax=Bacidia gigantensis TaxID=2732470 RepID=UPI001D03E8FD|nr:uncharacterized protein KY384_007902 [Bacidia gigantensis]KAG8527748.1 hypothetical protein KY384_007902 [Bacidia gigantensis]